MNNVKIFISLFDPRLPHIICYVGATDNLDRRLQEHISEKPNLSLKSKWIQRLSQEGVTPSITILKETTIDNAVKDELELIQKHKSHYLTNDPVPRLYHKKETISDKMISIRINSKLLNQIKTIATTKNISYQSLIKLWISEKVEIGIRDSINS